MTPQRGSGKITLIVTQGIQDINERVALKVSLNVSLCDLDWPGFRRARGRRKAGHVAVALKGGDQITPR